LQETHNNEILITGANGFLGKYVCEIFKENGFSFLTTDKSGDVDFIDLPFLNRKNYFLKNNVYSAKLLFEKYALFDVHFIHIGTSMMYKQQKNIVHCTTHKMS
jgi:hypothetical protein